MVTLTCGVSIAQAKPAKGKANALAPLPPDQWTYEAARHLLFRTGFGGTPEQVNALHAMGLRKAVTHVMNFKQQSDKDFPLEISPPSEWGMNPNFKDGKRLSDNERRDVRRAMRKKDTQMYTALRNWWMRRMVQSKQPLEENLTLFWHGLFSTGYQTVRVAYGMHAQNELFRENAAGNYGEMLHNIIHDPAMLRYLDNNTNVKGRPNENLAREIMELFAMGEGRGYTEKDIQEGARALTGNAYDQNSSKYVFRAKMHDAGKKTIFGQTGNFDGDEFVDLILQQEATAQFIAERLFAYFAYQDPDKKIVNALANELRDDNYELAPMLKKIFLSKAFYSDQSRGALIKSPVRLVVGTMRTLGINDNATSAAAVKAVQSMEQDLFQPPNVKGWEGGATWINSTTLFTRQNFAGQIVDGVYSKSRKGQSRGLDLVAKLKGKQFKTADQVVDYFAKALFVHPVSQQDRQQLIGFLQQDRGFPPSAQWGKYRDGINHKLRGLLVLMLSMPQYQLT
jgi:uncharacterized protein (DUF1800 family)